jgi:hypothetical protein
MGKSNAGSRPRAGDERLPDHQLQLDAKRPPGFHSAPTQLGELRRLFVAVGRQQRRRLGRLDVEHGTRIKFQFSQSVEQRRRQQRDIRRRLRQCRLDRIPGAGFRGLAGWTVVRAGRFGAPPATGLAIAADGR